VAADAKIAGPSVIGDGVRIGPGAIVEGSILWQDARVGNNAVIRDTIVGIGYEVPAGTTLDGKIVANE
jgi:mannose-1-phosphate guanylyltransferase